MSIRSFEERNFRLSNEIMYKAFSDFDAALYFEYGRKTRISFGNQILLLDNHNNQFQELRMKIVPTKETANLVLFHDTERIVIEIDNEEKQKHLIELWVKALNEARAALFYEKCEILSGEKGKYGFHKVKPVDSEKKYTVANCVFKWEVIPPGTIVLVPKDQFWSNYEHGVTVQFPLTIQDHKKESDGKVEFYGNVLNLKDGEWDKFSGFDPIDYQSTGGRGLEVKLVYENIGSPKLVLLLSSMNPKDEVRKVIKTKEYAILTFQKWKKECDKINLMGIEIADRLLRTRAGGHKHEVVFNGMSKRLSFIPAIDEHKLFATLPRIPSVLVSTKHEESYFSASSSAASSSAVSYFDASVFAGLKFLPEMEEDDTETSSSFPMTDEESLISSVSSDLRVDFEGDETEIYFLKRTWKISNSDVNFKRHFTTWDPVDEAFTVWLGFEKIAVFFWVQYAPIRSLVGDFFANIDKQRFDRFYCKCNIVKQLSSFFSIEKRDHELPEVEIVAYQSWLPDNAVLGDLVVVLRSLFDERGPKNVNPTIEGSTSASKRLGMMIVEEDGKVCKFYKS